MRVGPLKRTIGAGSKIGCVLDIDFRKVGQGDGDSFMSRDVFGHLCVITAALWGLQGRIFAGADHIDCGDNTAFDVTNITILALFYATAITAMHEIVCRDDDVNRNYYLATQDVAGTDYMYGGIWISDAGKSFASPTAITLNTWYLGAITHDGSTVRGYLKGVPYGSPAVAVGDIDNDDVSLTIGAREDGADRQFQGTIQKVWVYNYAEYAARILQRAIRARRN